MKRKSVSKPDLVQALQHSAKCLIERAGTPVKVFSARRDEVAFTTVLHLGLKISELSALTIDDVDLPRGTVRIRAQGRHGKLTLLPIPSELVPILAVWVEEIRNRGTIWLFPRSNGCQLSVSTFYERFERLAAAAGVRTFLPKMLGRIGGKWRKDATEKAKGIRTSKKRGRPPTTQTNELHRFCYEKYVTEGLSLSKALALAAQRFGEDAPRNKRVIGIYAKRHAMRSSPSLSMERVPKNQRGGAALFTRIPFR